MHKLLLVLLVIAGCKSGSVCKHGYGEYVSSNRVYNSRFFFACHTNSIFPQMYVHLCDSTLVTYTYQNTFQNFKRIEKCATSTP